MGYIDFDLGSTNKIHGIEASWGGHVSSGNTLNVYVDECRVLTNHQFVASKNIRYFPPVRGRVIRYETVALPHNELGQIATWSEAGGFGAFIDTTPPAGPTLVISHAVQGKWPTEVGVVYQAQISSDMITWQDFGAPITGDGTEKHFFYPTEIHGKGYFRIQAR